MRIKRMFCLVIVMLMLTSCTKKEIPYKSNAEDNITYDKTNTDGVNGVYIITDKGPVPVAYTNNGKLSLTGDVYYYNLKNVLENDETVKQKTFTHFDKFGCNVGGQSYDDFVKNTKGAYETLVTTGNWRLCPDIRYVQYGQKDTVAQEYLSFITQSFSDKFTDSVPHVTDVWETDIDCDGSNEAFVKACDSKYCLIVMISGTLGNNVVFSAFDENKSDATLFFADLDGNAKPSVMLLSGDKLKTVTVFKESSVTASYCVYLPVV